LVFPWSGRNFHSRDYYYYFWEIHSAGVVGCLWSTKCNLREQQQPPAVKRTFVVAAATAMRLKCTVTMASPERYYCCCHCSPESIHALSPNCCAKLFLLLSLLVHSVSRFRDHGCHLGCNKGCHKTPAAVLYCGIVAKVVVLKIVGTIGFVTGK
jgi:hypothetical protein